MNDDPIILRITRPYPSVEAFLAAEALTIDERGMVLVGAEALPSGTLVRFVVTLTSGEQVIKAEGRVHHRLPTTYHGPAGLPVRFKRYGGSTKETIERALAWGSRDRTSATDLSDPEGAGPLVTEHELSSPTAAPAPEPDGSASGLATSERDPSDREVSGVRHRPLGNVAPPERRDELLEKLRQRARHMTDARLAAFAARVKVS